MKIDAGDGITVEIGPSEPMNSRKVNKTWTTRYINTGWMGATRMPVEWQHGEETQTDWGYRVMARKGDAYAWDWAVSERDVQTVIRKVVADLKEFLDGSAHE